MPLNILPILPEIFMAITAMGLLIVGVNGGNRSAPVISLASAASMLIAIILLFIMGNKETYILNNMFKTDGFTQFVKLLILGGLITIQILAATALGEKKDLERFEFSILVTLAGIGMLLMVSSNNLLTLYMSLELQSLSLYVLAAMRRNSLMAAEAGVKYFTLGALSSGMILFGTSLIYGFTGSLDFSVIASTFAAWQTVPLGITFGMVFLLAGLSFKISAVPFHMWTPDVYQGAPTIVTAFFALVPKLAAFALLTRILFEPFLNLQDQWLQIIYALSLGSMIVGAFAALRQDDIKRLLAYSSIGNMGYVLIGLVAGTEQGISAILLYLLIYMIMTAGTFGIILSLRRDGFGITKIKDFAGLSRTSPMLAYALAILMFSMSGIPPMAGFFGKLFIFQAAVASGYYILAILGILTSVVAAYYYLRIVKTMFFDDTEDKPEITLPGARRAIIGLSLAFVLLFIAKPSFYIKVCTAAAASLFTG